MTISLVLKIKPYLGGPPPAKRKNKKVAAWIRKAGGMGAITEERASRIAKLCKLKGENNEKDK